MTMGIMPTGGQPEKDAGEEYWINRQAVASADAIARNRARLQQLDAEAAKPAATPGGGATGAGAPKKGEPVKMELGPLVAPGIQPDDPGVVAKVARDVGKGLVESGRQGVAGISDAVREGAEAFNGLGDWLEEKIGGRVAVPLTGIKELDELIENPLQAIAGGKDAKAPAEAESTTGGLVRETTRFLAGFIPFLRGGKALGLGKVAAPSVAGGATDALTKDPTEANLTDLVKQFPVLQGPVTELLASDPNDGEVTARAKKAFEGMGLGLVADGLVLGVRALAASRRARTTVPDAARQLEAARAEFGEVTDADFLPLGQSDGRTVYRRAAVAATKLEKSELATQSGVPDEVAAKGLTKVGEIGGDEVFVNFATIDEPGKVHKVIGLMADAFKGDIDEAARGVQTNKATKKLADRLNVSVSDLLNRQKGQPFNAEQAVAARRLLNASAEKLLALAERAASANAGPVDQFLFRRMMALHHAIQAEVLGARTETARALQSWSIPIGGGIEKSKAVQEMLEQMGGAGASKAMAQRLAILAKKGDQAAVDRFVGKTWGTASMDVIREAWVNALLSSPKTHIVNMTSNAALQVNSVWERHVASEIAQAWGGEVAPQEAAALAYGMISSLRDAWRLSAKSLRQGAPLDAAGKVDLVHEPAITGDFLRQSGHNGAAAAVDFIGTVARVPTRLLGAEDAFFKTIGYRAEVHAQALRLATAEGRTGGDKWRRMMEIANDPPEHVRLAAADAAAYNTFSNATGDWGAAMLKLRDKIPPVGFVMPFIKTPVNIARYAFERSPVAPLVGQWRADLAAGGARAELALARMATGSAVMLMAMDAASNGLITGAGPDDAGEMGNKVRQGFQPYSLFVGGKYYSYNRLDPLGMTMGFAADMAELIRRYDIEPDELDEVNEQVAAGIAMVANVVINKTYMQGLSSAFEALGQADDRPQQVADFLDKLAGSFVPAAVNAAGGAIDPSRAELMKIGDSVRARIPVLASQLTRKRDLWGQLVENDPGMGMFSPVVNALSPVAIRAAKDSPIDAEMERLDMNLAKIGKKVDFGGVAVNLRDHPEVYEQYVKLAGNELKHPAWGLGAKDLLDAIVTGKHDLSEVYAMQADTRKPEDGGKAKFIANIVTDFRRLARAEILADPARADFAAQIGGQKEKADAKKMPVIQ